MIGEKFFRNIQPGSTTEMRAAPSGEGSHGKPDVLTICRVDGVGPVFANLPQPDTAQVFFSKSSEGWGRQIVRILSVNVTWEEFR